MAKPNFTLPNKPAIKSGSILSYNYTDDFTFVPAPLTFNRDSAATRVNEKGLIEDVGYFGPELVQNGDFLQTGSEQIINGDFSDGSTGWTIERIWNIVNGVANGNGANGSSEELRTTATIPTGIYKIVFEIKNYVSGSVRALFQGSATTDLSANGVYTIYQTTTDARYLKFRGTNFYGSIDNVSIKEVGQNWTFGTGWSMGDSKAVFSGVDFANLQPSSSLLTIGRKYKLSLTAEVTNGSFKVQHQSSSDLIEESNSGSYNVTFVATANTFTIARAGVGVQNDFTITNVSVVEVLGDKPRIDYSDSLTEPSLLLEPQSTNLVTYSEDLNSSSWFKTNVTVTNNSNVSPEGLQNAILINEGTAAATQHWFYQSIPLLSGNTYTISFYAKYVDRKNMFVNVYDGATSNFIFYDIQNGVVLNTGSSAVTDILDVGNGWYRIIYTRAIVGSGTNFRIGMADDIPTQTYTGQNKQALVYGFQLEQLPYATSYIPTAGSTATRLGETAINAGDVNVFNSEEGVLYAEFATISKNYNFPTIRIFDGTNNNAVRIFPVGLGGNNIQVQVDSGGSISFVSTSTSNDPTQYNKIAVKYQKDNFSFYINGTQHATDNSGNAPVGLNKFEFQSNFFGKVRNLKVFNKALTDRELEILTIQ